MLSCRNSDWNRLGKEILFWHQWWAMLPLTSLLQGLSGTETENNPQKQLRNTEGEGRLNTFYRFYASRHVTVTSNSFNKYNHATHNSNMVPYFKYLEIYVLPVLHGERKVASKNDQVLLPTETHTLAEIKAAHHLSTFRTHGPAEQLSWGSWQCQISFPC